GDSDAVEISGLCHTDSTPSAWGRFRAAPSQRLDDRLQEFIRRLTAHGQPDEAGIDGITPPRSPLGGGVKAAERSCGLNKGAVVDEGICFVFGTERESNQEAKALHLLCSNVVARVIGESRIAHGANLGMLH